MKRIHFDGGGEMIAEACAMQKALKQQANAREQVRKFRELRASRDITRFLSSLEFEVALANEALSRKAG